MSRKLLHVNHHLSSGCCMWSGIEDIYATRTNQQVPEAFLLGLSSFGESVFIKIKDEKRPFMFSVVDGRTKKTYDRIKDILGLSYHISEGRTLEYAIKSIKKEIDCGKPVILGPLDMYHLPYLKMYHKVHIPMHYILMAGYDEEKESILIYDCDRIDLIDLPLEELVKAWQIEKNAVGDKNGFIRFELSEQLPSKYELADLCLRKKAERQLCEKPDFIGVHAYEKIAREFPSWKDEFSASAYKEVLAALTEGFGMVPKLPNAILGSKEEDIEYQANYNRLAGILIQLGKEYHRSNWLKAADLFLECGRKINEITNRITQYYCNGEECLEKIPELFLEIGRCAKKAYLLIKDDKEVKEDGIRL